MNAMILNRARRDFFKKLPNRLVCPCCKKSQAKERFGVRLMNGFEVFSQGAKPQFYRQSYCANCRS